MRGVTHGIQPATARMGEGRDFIYTMIPLNPEAEAQIKQMNVGDNFCANGTQSFIDYHGGSTEINVYFYDLKKSSK